MTFRVNPNQQQGDGNENAFKDAPKGTYVLKLIQWDPPQYSDRFTDKNGEAVFQSTTTWQEQGTGKEARVWVTMPKNESAEVGPAWKFYQIAEAVYGRQLTENDELDPYSWIGSFVNAYMTPKKETGYMNVVDGGWGAYTEQPAPRPRSRRTSASRSRPGRRAPGSRPSRYPLPAGGHGMSEGRETECLPPLYIPAR
jgi:hypothetical protein